MRRRRPAQGPPHEWTFGSWTGGIFPAGDTEGAACLGSPTVIFTRDIVMRVSVVDTAYRERTIETVAQTPTGLEFRFTAAPPVLGPMGPRAAPGCRLRLPRRAERAAGGAQGAGRAGLPRLRGIPRPR